MRILWIVNTIFPYPAEQLNMKETVFGGWLNGLANVLKERDEITLAIASVYSGNTLLRMNDGKIEYFLIPKHTINKYDSKAEKYWREVNAMYKPDLVHIHGTEYPHGLEFLRACPKERTVTSIQGLIYVYSKVYFANISIKDIIKNITLRDIIKRDNIIQSKNKFSKRGITELEILKRTNAIIGRTKWDYANTKYISDATYFHCNETLRESFYKYEWKFEDIEKHSIFCSQASYPIKGFHYLIETIYILKKKYPDIKLYVSGFNILDKSNIWARLKITGYGKYISKLIKKYKLEEQIIFTGLLDEKQMLQKFLKTHVFVLPSAIENSSNSLGEAMLMGMPCVASNSGGTADILQHSKEGYLYPYTEPAMCAEYIEEIFENEAKAISFGKEARKTALKRHNSHNNVENTIKIYKKIIKEGEI